MNDDNPQSTGASRRPGRRQDEPSAPQDAAPEPQSLADRMRARREEQAAQSAAEEAQEPQSLADRMRARQAEQSAAEEAPSEPEAPARRGFSRREDKPAEEEAAAEESSSAFGRNVRAAATAASAATAATAGAAAGAARSFGRRATEAGERIEEKLLDTEAAEQLKRVIGEQKTKFNRLIERSKLTQLVRDTSSLENQVNSLPQTVAQLRARGYAFRSYLEQKSEVLANQWGEVNGEIRKWIDEESRTLGEHVSDAEKFIRDIDAAKAATTTQEHLTNQLSSVLETLDTRVSAAEKHIRQMYDDLRREVQVMNKQLTEVGWFLEQRDEASFSFMPAEAVFLVAEATWDAGGKNMNGILFLTDQRVVFEQKETVGKTLGLFGGQKAHELKWEAPVSAVEEVRAENKGLFGGKDMLYFTMGGGATHRSITVEVKGGADCKFWAQQIKRMVSGDAHDERAIEPDPEMIERLRNAPTQCAVCGGTLPQIVRGQLEVSCKYCGSVVRL